MARGVPFQDILDARDASSKMCTSGPFPPKLTSVGVQEQRDAGRRKGGMRDDEVSGEEVSDDDEQEQNVSLSVNT